MKKFLTYSVVVATIAWSLGISAVLPAAAAYAPTDGDLIKTATYPAVYYIAGGKKYLFVNRATFGTWKDNFNGLKVISQTDFDALSLGGNVTARPGVNLIKFDNSDLVYAVTPGAVLVKVDAATKTALYGSAAPIVIQSSFENNYTKSSATLTATSKYPDGSLVSNGGTTYLVMNGALQAVSGDAFTANAFKTSYVHAIPSISGYSVGSAITSKVAAVSDIVAGAGTGTGVITGSASVSLASNTAAAGTIVAGQAIADLGSFVFSGTGTVTTLKVKRIGVSQDTTLNNVYLYDGNTKLTDAGTVSNGYVTFSNPSGIFSISGSRTITVKADILASTNGQTVGVAINAASDISGISVGGSFPVTGNLMSIASATNLATADFTGSVTGAASTINAGTNGVTVWSNAVSISNKAVSLKYVKVKQIGSVASSNLQNFKLYVDGVQVATAGLDGDNNLAFDLSSSPVNMNTGSRTIEVRADVVAGASKTFSFSLQQASDVVFVDTNYGVAITPTKATASFSAISTGTSTINGASTGALTITTDPSYSSTQIVKNSSNVTLGKWVVKAYGEDVKVMQLTAQSQVVFGAGVTSTNEYLNNVAIYVDGVQVGSAQNVSLSGLTGLSSSSTASTAYATTTYGSGNLFTVVAGQTRTIEIRADLQLNDSTRVTGVSANLGIPASQVQGVSSFQTWPTTATTYNAANSLTVVGGQLTGGKTASFVNQTVAPNTAAQKIGSFTVQASNAEGVRVSNVAVGIQTTGSLNTNYLSDLYIAYGSTVSNKVNPQSANNFSVDVTIPANGSQVFDVFATIGNQTGTVSTTLALTGRTVSSQTTANLSTTVGQTVTVGSGSLTTTTFGPIVNTSMQSIYTVGGTSPDSFVVYNFKASSAPIIVDELTFTVGGTAVANSEVPVTAITVNGQTANILNNTATVTGLNLTVPNTGSGIDVKVGATLNNVGSQGITSGKNATTTLTSVKWHAGGTVSTTAVTASSSNSVYIVNSKPTVSLVAVTDKLTNNTTRIASVTVSADTKGAVTLKTLPLAFSTTTGVGYGTLVVKDGGSTISTSNTTILYASGVGTTTVTFTGGYKINAGQTKTFDIYLTPTGVSGSAGTASLSSALGSSALFTWDDSDGNVSSDGLNLVGTYIYNYPTNTVSVQN